MEGIRLLWDHILDCEVRRDWDGKEKNGIGKQVQIRSLDLLFYEITSGER